MNAKTIYWIIAISAVCIGAVIVSKYYSQEPTDTIVQQCTIENPVWCDELIIWLQSEYNMFSQKQIDLNKKADVYRAISKVWTGESEKLN